MKPQTLQRLCGLVVALLALTGWWLFKTHYSLGGNEWPIKPNPVIWRFGAWLLPLAVLFIFGGLAGVSAYDRFRRSKTRREQETSRRLCLGAICILALLWPWSLLGPTPLGINGVTNLVAATFSDVATGYFGLAYQVDNARDFSTNYARDRQRVDKPSQAHVATHPPETTLAYYAARRIYEAAPPLQSAFTGLAQWLTNTSVDKLAVDCDNLAEGATGERVSLPDSAVGCALWCAFLLSLATALTVPAVYLLAAAGGSEAEPYEGRGLVAAALYALAPSVGLFSFGIDTVIACGTAWTLVLMMRRKPVAAGALLGLTCSLSFGALAVGVIVVLALVLQTISLPTPERHANVIRTAADAARLIIGFLIAWIALAIALPMQPLLIYKQAMAAHQIATLATRSYGHWLVFDLVVFAVFSGWPLCAAALTRRYLGRCFIECLGLATLVTAALLALSGKARGEVERLWMFLLPPLCAYAAYALLGKANSQNETEPATEPNEPVSIDEAAAPAAPPKPKSPALPVTLVILLLTLQAAQSLMMAAALAPLVRP